MPLKFEKESTTKLNYIIQPATWHDLNELRTLEQICFPIDRWPLLDLIAVLSLRKVTRLKATHKNKMIGFVAADIKKKETSSWIATLAVLPDYRRQGVATALLKRCEATLENPSIRLCVRKNNIPAIKLYTQNGYIQIDKWSRYYTDGEDAIILEKNRAE